MSTCKELTIKTRKICHRPVKHIATHVDKEPRFVCGVHAKAMSDWGWKINELGRWQAEGRGVAGWLMVPVRVIVDTKGAGKIVEATFNWEHARMAQDDFGDEEDFEVCEPMAGTPFWQGVESDDNGMQMERPTQEERERFKTIVFEDIEEWLGEEATPTMLGTWVPEALL